MTSEGRPDPVEPIVVKKTGPLAWLGCGCGGCGGLMLLGAVAAAAVTLAGGVNGSEEGTAWLSAASGGCCGAALLVLGAALFVFGRRKVEL